MVYAVRCGMGEIGVNRVVGGKGAYKGLKWALTKEL